MSLGPLTAPPYAMNMEMSMESKNGNTLPSRWEYRIIFDDRDKDAANHCYYIGSVHFDADSDTILSISDSACPIGDTIDQLQDDMVLMSEAISQEVLRWSELA
jgi:hypothetical protein